MDASNIVGAALDSLEAEATVIVGVALAFGATLLAVRRGWGYLKGFSRG
jgi:hypothetical protein